jgi:hypothetical protein
MNIYFINLYQYVFILYYINEDIICLLKYHIIICIIILIYVFEEKKFALITCISYNLIYYFCI